MPHSGTTPLYAQISTSGSTFSVALAPADNTVGSSWSGYANDVFDGLPDECPLIDYRCNADGAIRVIRANLRTPHWNREVTVCGYLDAIRACGVRVMTVGDYRAECRATQERFGVAIPCG